MVKLTEVQEAVRSVGFVGMITYPYSSARHDAACEVFDRGRFVLYNQNKPHLKPLELYVAHSLKELGEITRIKLTRGEVEKDEEEEEDAPVIDLNPSNKCVLLPATLHEAWRLAGSRAAGLRRLAGRRALAAARWAWAQWAGRAWRHGARGVARGLGVRGEGGAGENRARPAATTDECPRCGQADDYIVTDLRARAVRDRSGDAGPHAAEVGDGGTSGTGRAQALRARHSTLTWALPRRMDRQMGWGYATRARAVRRRK
jgi:hypothetical protein